MVWVPNLLFWCQWIQLLTRLTTTPWDSWQTLTRYGSKTDWSSKLLTKMFREWKWYIASQIKKGGWGGRSFLSRFSWIISDFQILHRNVWKTWSVPKLVGQDCSLFRVERSDIIFCWHYVTVLPIGKEKDEITFEKPHPCWEGMFERRKAKINLHQINVLHITFFTGWSQFRTTTTKSKSWGTPLCTIISSTTEKYCSVAFIWMVTL